jgi:hypothetical protein
MGFLEAGKGGLDRHETFMGDEIAVTGDRPIRKLPYLVFGFLDKGPAHGGYRCRASERVLR